MTARFVRVKLAADLTGYTEKAIRRKIEAGVWIEGQQFVRAPDNNILIDMEGYNKWVAGQQLVGSSQRAVESKSASLGKVESYGQRSTSRLQRQT